MSCRSICISFTNNEKLLHDGDSKQSRNSLRVDTVNVNSNIINVSATRRGDYSDYYENNFFLQRVSYHEHVPTSIMS